MTHYTKLFCGTWHFLLCAIVAVSTMLTATSCGDDEPQPTLIGYYLEVEEEFLINGSKDLINRYYNPKDMMLEAIQATYPVADTKGKDEAVIAACDEVYQTYYWMYGNEHYEDHLTCKLHLIRATMEGTIVKQSEILRTYVFDVNPYEIEE